MSESLNRPIIHEPPVDPLEDTSPTGVRKLVSRPPKRRGAVLFQLVLSVGALAFTVAAAILYIQQGNRPVVTPPPPTIIIATQPATSIPTRSPPTANPEQPVKYEPPSPDVLAEMMMQPVSAAPPEEALYRQENAFTIAPARPRSSPMQYSIQVGDTIEKIAKKFNISQDTIIWNNDVGYINRLQIGTTLTILPVNGILYRPSADETIAAMAAKYKVSPYAIIDSEYNKLSSATPDTLIPANALDIMIPGGSTKTVAIYWQPTINRKKPTTNFGGSVKEGTVVFGGGAGSCGYQRDGGGDGGLGYPLNGYHVIRGFSSYHSGIDLADPTGTPVMAAGAGTVIFAGWSDWGYGNSIVIAHTPGLYTLYGHLSAIGVTCGQFVGRAQVIGRVGTTGNSTGPHLHFEVRVGDSLVPIDPVGKYGGF